MPTYTNAPSPDQAYLFALALESGVGPVDAMAYFSEDGALPSAINELAFQWARSAAVRSAQVQLRGGKDWHKLSLVERMRLALDKHHSQLAFFLMSNPDYASLDPVRTAKTDRAREALERKLASASSQDDPGAKFWENFIAAKTTATVGSSTGEPRVFRS